MKQRTGTTKRSQVAYEILAYLAEHPHAQDTLEGVVEWWLLGQKIRQQAALVSEALGELVAKGFVLEHSGKDSRTHYRIDQHKYEEIRELLKQKPE